MTRFVQNALAAPLEDPVQALTPIHPPLPTPARNSSFAGGSGHPPPYDQPGFDAVPSATVQAVLSQRRFRMLTPHTILKSFHQPDAFLGNGAAKLSHIEGISDLYRIEDAPIWLVSNPSVKVSDPIFYLMFLSLMRCG
jgi:hypothetical protein